MHAAEREKKILELMQATGFITFQDIERNLDASPATLRRDLDRLQKIGAITRLRGGAQLAGAEGSERAERPLGGVPFHENIDRFPQQKARIGRAAADLCAPGETVIIDGGSTTLQMCPHLEALGLSVLTNSLHIVSALLSQASTRISVPAGTVFREQNIVLSPFEDDGIGRFRATKMFMGAAAIGPHGLMQNDVLLVQAERRLLERADEVIVLVDSSKFKAPSGHMVCDLDDIDILVTDPGIRPEDRAMLERAGIRIIVTEPGKDQPREAA